MSRVPKAFPAVLGLAVLGITLMVAGTGAHEPGAIPAAARPAPLNPAVIPPRQVPGYGNLPIRFEVNVGQAPSEIEYLARGNGYTVALTEQAAILGLRPVAAPQNRARSTDPAPATPASPPPARLRLSLLHARPQPPLQPERQQTSVSNYFVGNDRTKWHSNIANYAAVRYERIYPGIDWVVYGNPRQLEYDFVVAPRSDPRQIALRIDGAQSVSLDDNGDLLVKVRDVTLRQLKPVVYQSADDGARHNIEGRYVLTHRQVAFALGPYDHSRQLIIDPTFVYSTYLGGSGRDAATGVAVDNEGNAYVAGATTSTDFSTVNPLQASNHSASTGYPGNAFIFKLNAAGSALIYSTYLGGSGNDTANGIAVDSAGNVYVTGSTTSTDFPTVAPFQAANHATSPSHYPANAFITKLNPSGSALVYSTYLGGSGPKGSSVQADTANAIAVDESGNAYVAGATGSTDFPTLNPFQAVNNTGGSVIGSNAFITNSTLQAAHCCIRHTWAAAPSTEQMRLPLIPQATPTSPGLHSRTTSQSTILCKTPIMGSVTAPTTRLSPYWNPPATPCCSPRTWAVAASPHLFLARQRTQHARRQAPAITRRRLPRMERPTSTSPARPTRPISRQ